MIINHAVIIALFWWAGNCIPKKVLFYAKKEIQPQSSGWTIRSENYNQQNLTKGNDTQILFYSEISKADAKKKADAWIIEQKVSELTGVSSAPAQTSYTFERWAMIWLKNHKEKLSAGSPTRKPIRQPLPAT